jgi:hypothetical protein
VVTGKKSSVENSLNKAKKANSWVNTLAFVGDTYYKNFGKKKKG